MPRERVVIITNTDKHHRFFCGQIASQRNVVAIVHPQSKPVPMSRRLKKARRELNKYGLLYTALRLSERVTGAREPDRREYAEQRLAEGVAKYDALDSDLIHHLSKINSKESVEVIKGFEPTVVVCLGGAIFRKRIIEAVPLMLNFHSGVSPVYNGSATIRKAFADGHLHLCGGTLMTMSPRIDGGDILAHVFPSIEPEDSPGYLFIKTIMGASQVVCDFLGFIADEEKTRPFTKVPQPASFNYVRGADFTVVDGLRIRRLIREGVTREFERPTEFVKYWDCASDVAAASALRETLDTKLFGSPCNA